MDSSKDISEFQLIFSFHRTVGIYSYSDNWNSRAHPMSKQQNISNRQITNKMKMKISKEQPNDKDDEENM